MIGEQGANTDGVTALKRYLEDGVRVLSNAVERLANGPLPPQAYQELAESCNALATALRTRAEHERRTDQAEQDSWDDGSAHGIDSVHMFAICGTYRFRSRQFLAYGLELVGGRGGAVLAVPGHVRWRWTRRLLAVRGRNAEEILGKLIPMMNVRLVRLGSAHAGSVGYEGQLADSDEDANNTNVNGESGLP